MILVLIALFALFAVACGDSEEDTVVDPTPEPTVAPTSTPEPTPEPTATPEPPPAPDAPTAPVAPDAPAKTYDVPDFGPETTGQDIADALFSPEEITCITSALGPEGSQALLEANVLDPAAQGSTGVFGECLTEENSVVLFLAGFKAASGGALGEDTLNCVGNAIAPHYKVLFAGETDPAVMFGILPCLSPEEMTALQSMAPAPQ
jgi:hypothetical protein